MKRCVFAVLACVVALSTRLSAQVQTESLGLQHSTFVVKLLSPISTKTSSEGDMFTAVVEEPTQYKDAVVEGKITKLKKPKKGVGKGKSEIAFQFESLTFNGKTVPVDVELKEVANSKGVKAVDEEGQVVGKTSNKKRIATAAAGAGIGALVGALAGGAKGAAAGSAIGLGAGIAIGLTMTTTGSDLEFLPGSTFTLDVSDSTRQKK
jgi:hypothetical protein